MPVKTLPSLSLRMRPGGFRSTMKRRISDTANMPTIIEISSTPESRSVTPKVKRGCPAGFSRPMQATSRPSSSEISAFTIDEEPMKTALARPSTTSQKYSNELNLIATSARLGAMKIITSVPNRPPSAENHRPAPRAVSAWPLSVIA